MNANTERWQVLDELFQRASEMDPSLRGDFLRDVCGSDTELRNELEALRSGFRLGSLARLKAHWDGAWPYWAALKRVSSSCSRASRNC